MTPREKAIELVHKLYPLVAGYHGSKKNVKTAKKVGLLMVNEILNGEQVAYSIPIEKGHFFIDYWNDVKQEIQKL